MHINIPFIVLTFIIIIAVILLSDTLISAMLIVSLLANFLGIVSHFGNLTKNMLGISIQNRGVTDEKEDIEPAAAPDNTPEEKQDTVVYDPDYEVWNSYRSSYTDCYTQPQVAVGTSCAETAYSVDAMNALYAQRRARDKKCSDGWASKSANYYKHHYGDEFEECEKKVWWGNFDN